jgi:hypothetical protein
MASASKCPKCGKVVAKLLIEPIPASLDKKTFPAVAFSCPSCNSVLGVQIDPVTVSASTVKRLASALKGGKA